MNALIAGTALMVLVYLGTMILCGKSRDRYKVPAPAVSGHPMFERAMRVQMNTLEQLAIALPGVWLLGLSVSMDWAAAVAVVWSLGRIWYAVAYMADPAKRGPGFLIGFATGVGSVLVGGIAALVRVIGG
jgi:glutathione S-transferase